MVVHTFERLRRSLLRIIGWFRRRRHGFVHLEYDSSFTLEDEGPPDHWVERVRQGAPGLLEPSLRQRAQPQRRRRPPKPRERRPSEAVSPPAKQFQTPQPGSPAANQVETPEPGSPAASQVPEVGVPPEVRVPPKRRAALQRVVRPRPTEPVPEALAEAVLERPLAPAQPTPPPRTDRAREADPSPQPPARRRTHPGRARSQGSPKSSPAERQPGALSEPSPEHTPDAPPSDERRLGFEPHPWPELPPSLTPPEADVDALRAWERERRLDREQVAL